MTKVTANAPKGKATSKKAAPSLAKTIVRSSHTGRFVMSPPTSGQVPKERIVKAVIEVKRASKKKG